MRREGGERRLVLTQSRLAHQNGFMDGSLTGLEFQAHQRVRAQFLSLMSPGTAPVWADCENVWRESPEGTATARAVRRVVFKLTGKHS